MNLADAPFLIFLGLVILVLTLASRGGRRSPVGLLVVASLAFYASWNPWYLAPLLVTAFTDYRVSRALGRTSAKGRRRLLLGVSLVVDLGLLAAFKYYDPLLAGLNLAGLALHPTFRLLFMTGISFYTFQSLGFVLEVYREDQTPAPSFLNYLAFVSFFPTLLAGPITRGATLLPAFDKPFRIMDPDLAGRAFFLLALGFLKKVVVADHLAVNLVDRVFEQPLFFSSLEIAAGLYAYAAQIYCDFSGYSDIAIGAALLLGFQLKDNFKSPYRATSLAEFWKRWHISFSDWLMNHVYFSIPGKRRRFGPSAAILATFILGGIWHGASWCFLAWGLIHGVGLALERLLEGGRRPTPKPLPVRLLRGLLTFHIVLVAWVFFRADGLEVVRQIGTRLLEGTLGAGNIPLPALAIALAAILLQTCPETWLPRIRDRFVQLPGLAQGACCVLVGLLVRLAAGSKVATFIYQGF